MLWLIFKMTTDWENGPQCQWVFRKGHTRTRWHCPADSNLFWVIREARELMEEQKLTQNRQKQSIIKVTAPWQISAADESLTWGCWIDNLSMGTLLAFSSFWERREQTFAGEYHVKSHPRQTEQLKVGHLLLLKMCGEIKKTTPLNGTTIWIKL